eukprot:scaffold22355_cov57-Cyclotella_meneghiniana.AAC.1
MVLAEATGAGGNMNKVGVEEGGRRCRGIVGHGHHDVHGCVEVNIEKMTTIGGKKAANTKEQADGKDSRVRGRIVTGTPSWGQEITKRRNSRIQSD